MSIQPTIYKKYKNNLYVKLPTGYHCIGQNHTADGLAPVTIGSWSKQPVDRGLTKLIIQHGEHIDPPWRGKQ